MDIRDVISREKNTEKTGYAKRTCLEIGFSLILRERGGETRVKVSGDCGEEIWLLFGCQTERGREA